MKKLYALETNSQNYPFEIFKEKIRQEIRLRKRQSDGYRNKTKSDSSKKNTTKNKATAKRKQRKQLSCVKVAKAKNGR
jgi:hypothetical protein